MKKAVLFDFDGTLINTNELIFSSYKVAFKTVLNREIEMEEMLNLYGRPLHASLMEYGEACERLCQVYREFNLENHDKLAKPFDGALTGVKKIREKGYLTGIVTSKRLPMVERGLSLLGMNNIFDLIVTPDDTEKSKPDPEPIIFGCKKLNVDVQNTIYVGDSIFDVKAAKNANTKVAVVKYTLTPHKQILSLNPDFFVDTIEEFADMLQ
jgi:pyrophosphatase PpaX